MRVRCLILISATMAITFAELVETNVDMVIRSMCALDKFRTNQIAIHSFEYDLVDDHGSAVEAFYTTFHAEACALTEMYIKNLRAPLNERKEREEILKISYVELFAFAFHFLDRMSLSRNLRNELLEGCGVRIR